MIEFLALSLAAAVAGAAASLAIFGLLKGAVERRNRRRWGFCSQRRGNIEFELFFFTFGPLGIFLCAGILTHGFPSHGRSLIWAFGLAYLLLMFLAAVWISRFRTRHRQKISQAVRILVNDSDS